MIRATTIDEIPQQVDGEGCFWQQEDTEAGGFAITCDFQPGNGTRYTFVSSYLGEDGQPWGLQGRAICFSASPAGGGTSSACYCFGLAGSKKPLAYSYVGAKLGIKSAADAIVITAVICKLLGRPPLVDEVSIDEFRYSLGSVADWLEEKVG